MIRFANIFILLALCRMGLYAQPDRDFPGPGRERIMEKMEAMRVAFLTNRLDLTTEESTRFWPVYNEYAKMRMELRRDMREQQRDLKGKNLSDEDSKRALENQIAIQEKELTLKKNYYEKFKAILPPQKLAKLEPAEMEFNQEVLREIKKRKERRMEGGPRRR